MKITTFGNAKQVRDFIKPHEDVGVRYGVVSISSAQFLPHSLISRLTEKKQKTIITALALVYYDIPKKIGLVQLAE